MKLAGDLAGGGDKYSKTLPHNGRGRNEESCEEKRGITGVPVVVEPIDVPVPLTIVPIQIEDVAVAVRVPKNCTRSRLVHISPQSASEAVKYLASVMPWRLVPSIFIFFEVSAYITLSQTLTAIMTGIFTTLWTYGYWVRQQRAIHKCGMKLSTYSPTTTLHYT